MKSLSAKKYIRNPQALEEFQCGVCYELPEEVYQCVGPCRTKFCLPCFSKVKASGDQCPFRCSKPFEIAPCKTALISFSCPFDPAQCQTELNSVHDFNNHYQQCKFVSEEWGDWLHCRAHYRCDKGHQLLFLMESTLDKMYGYGKSYSAANNHVCAACGEQGLSRSICPECSEVDKVVIYCGKCRKIPCTQAKCTYQHPITVREAYHHMMVCDFCGVSCKIRGLLAYSDKQCNFDICELCYKGMPQTHQQVPSLLKEEAVKHLFKNNVPQHPVYWANHHLLNIDSSDDEIDMVLGHVNELPQSDDEQEEEEEPEVEVSVGHVSGYSSDPIDDQLDEQAGPLGDILAQLPPPGFEDEDDWVDHEQQLDNHLGQHPQLFSPEVSDEVDFDQFENEHEHDWANEYDYQF